MAEPVSMRALLILGMHRSGTSAVSRIIHMLGADIGAPLLPAQTDNPSGFWELAAVKELHDRILQSQGSAWDALIPMATGWFESALAADARHELLEVLRRNFSTSSLFVVKEPQLCLLLPLWNSVMAELGMHAGVVLVLRDPVAVADSLHVRDDMSRHRAMALWLLYMIDAERKSRGWPRHFISYEDFVKNWRVSISALAARFGIQWPVNLARMASEADEFLRPGSWSAGDADPDWASQFPWVAQTYNILQRFAKHGEDGAGLAELDRIRDEFHRALGAFGPIVEEAESARPARQLAQLLSQAEGRLFAIMTSTSWRLTAPLRRTIQKLRRLRKRLTGRPPMVITRSRAAGRTRRRKPVIMQTGAGGGAYFDLSRSLPEGLDAALRKAYGIETPTRISMAALGPAGDVTPLPLVSIIVPVFNNLACTLLCLESIPRNAPKFAYEVIVVDDASTERGVRHLSGCANLRYLRNRTNQGFVHACNRGAGMARGRYLAILNSDTLVQPRWLDELVATIEADGQIGLVGAKLLNTDGTLQEAGAMVWSDAAAWNVGRDEDPRAPEFNFMRDVDYCSGAAILVRRNVFLELGGFNTAFAPAYYEDTDLAFRVRRHGMRVVYQPLSSVIHLEGQTSGKNVDFGIKAYQQINRAKFISRWAQELAGRPAHRGELNRLSSQRAGQVLVIDSRTPTPDQDSGSVDAFNMMRILLRLGCQVTFIPAQELQHEGSYTEDLQRIGVRCLYRPFCTSPAQHLRAEGARYEFVFLNRLPAAHEYSRLVRRYSPRTKVIFNTVDLHFLRVSREVEMGGSLRERIAAWLTKWRELAQIDCADCTLLMSSAEIKLISSLRPKASLFRLPLIITTEDRQDVAFEDRHGLLFIGGFMHKPNVDAVRFLIDSIWPLLSKALPDTRLYIVGSNAPSEIMSLGVPGVEIVGHAAEIAHYFNNCRVNLAPLRFGAGIKGKIGRALGFGLPTVATTLAVEGMDLNAGHEVLVADDPAGFAARVAELYSDRERWCAMSAAGRRFFEEHYSMERGMRAYKTLLERGTVPALGVTGAQGPARVGK